jgi:hypothetical protein
MIATFVELLGRLRRESIDGVVPERSGRIEMPPASLDGVSILPIPRDFDSTCGRFPSKADAERFLAERTLRGERLDEPASEAAELAGHKASV